MSRFGGSGARTLSEDEKEVVQTINDRFSHSELLHILEIFRGNPRNLSRYYGEDASTEGYKQEIAEAIVREYREDVEDLLSTLDTEFTRSNTKKNKLEKNLVARGIPGDLVDEVEPTRRQLVLFAYHLFYNESDFEAKLRILNLNSRLFKESSERTYRYSREFFDLENFKQEVDQYVETRNGELHRPFTIRYNETDELIYLDFFKETARVKNNVFKCRKSGEVRRDNDIPTVTHESSYIIKTLLCRVDKSSDDEVKFVFKSNPQNGWTREIRKFFNTVSGIEEPFDESNQEIDEGASEVLENVLETARDTDEGVDEEDLEETITESLQELAEESTNESIPDISEDDIQWVGLVVDDDDNTMIESNDFTAQTGLSHYIQNTPGARERLLHILEEADEDNLGLRIRSTLGDVGSEEFVIWRKHWTEDARVDSRAHDILNSIFKGDRADE